MIELLPASHSEGGAKQVEGKLQKGAGNAQQAAENANKGKV